VTAAATAIHVLWYMFRDTPRRWREGECDSLLGLGGFTDKRRRLLIVDDEPLILSALTRLLKAEYEVTTLASPEEALRRLSSGDCWDLILSDIMMPGLSGVDFARLAVVARPELAGRILLMTGGVFTPTTIRLLEQNGSPCWQSQSISRDCAN